MLVSFTTPVQAEKQRVESKLVVKRSALKTEKERSGAAERRVEKLRWVRHLPGVCFIDCYFQAELSQKP